MRLKRLKTGLLVAAIAAPLAGAANLAAQQLQHAGGAPVAPPATADSVKALADAICAQVALLPADADPSRVEADIVFALSQSGADLDTQISALKVAGPICLTGPVRGAALANALDGITKGKTAGTGAILSRSGQGGFTSGTGFSSPGINVGGGSVNYSN